MKKINLAKYPTAIQKLRHTSEKTGKDIYIWREDQAGFLESGNKVRKLEFLLADALEKGCDWIITCGGPQSNHTRATTIAARHMGLGISVCLPNAKGLDLSKPTTGNLWLNQVFGAHLVWVDPEILKQNGLDFSEAMQAEAEAQKRNGKKPYIIPLGGSNPVGCLGYMNAVTEMLQTWKDVVPGSTAPDSIFCAIGTAGTFVGIQLGLEKEKQENVKLFGVNVLGPKELTENFLNRLTIQAASHFGMNLPRKNAQMIDHYWGQGYALATDEDLRFYIELARSEGILLDPCYTGKAFQAMISEIKKNAVQFGQKILFVHTGGGFGNFAYSEQFQKVL